MADETRRPGESWAQFQNRQILQDRLKNMDAVAKVQRAQMAEQTRKAVEGIKAALAEDRANGLEESARLRDVRPTRPKILDQSPEWDWPADKVAKFTEAQQKAREIYYEHVALARLDLLDAQMLKDLPQAIKFCDAAVKAAEQAAQEGNT